MATPLPRWRRHQWRPAASTAPRTPTAACGRAGPPTGGRRGKEGSRRCARPGQLKGRVRQAVAAAASAAARSTLLADLPYRDLLQPQPSEAVRRKIFAAQHPGGHVSVRSCRGATRLPWQAVRTLRMPWITAGDGASGSGRAEFAHAHTEGTAGGCRRTTALIGPQTL